MAGRLAIDVGSAKPLKVTDATLEEVRTALNSGEERWVQIGQALVVDREAVRSVQVERERGEAKGSRPTGQIPGVPAR